MEPTEIPSRPRGAEGEPRRGTPPAAPAGEAPTAAHPPGPARGPRRRRGPRARRGPPGAKKRAVHCRGFPPPVFVLHQYAFSNASLVTDLRLSFLFAMACGPFPYLDPQKGTFFCSLRYFCSFCQLSGISEIYAETANFMFRTHFVANPANLATRNARKSAENAGNRRKMRGNRRKMRGNRRKAQNQLVLNMAGRTEMCVFWVNERVFQQCAFFFAF